MSIDLDKFYGVIPTDLSELDDVVITTPVIGNILEYDGNNWVNIPKQISIYGTELHQYTLFDLFTSTSTTSVDVINENTEILPIGEYEITLSANCSYDATNSDGVIEFQFDEAPISDTTGNNEVYRLEFKDSGGNNPPGSGTNQKDTFHLTFPISVTVSESKNILLQIKSEAAAVEMNIWNTYIKLIRVK